MSADMIQNPYGFNTHDFAPPDQIRLSPEAMEEASQFLSELQRHERGSHWIVAFAWCYQRSLRKTPDSKNIDEGPGIDIAGYRSSEIPSEAVEVRSGIPMAFIIPKEQLNRATKKEIVETRLVSGRLSYELR